MLKQRQHSGGTLVFHLGKPNDCPSSLWNWKLMISPKLVSDRQNCLLNLVIGQCNNSLCAYWECELRRGLGDLEFDQHKHLGVCSQGDLPGGRQFRGCWAIGCVLNLIQITIQTMMGRSIKCGAACGGSFVLIVNMIEESPWGYFDVLALAFPLPAAWLANGALFELLFPEVFILLE